MRIKNNKLNLRDTLFSGQCFRMVEEPDNSFTLILEDRVVNIREAEEYLEIESNKTDNLEDIIKKYFDLERDYSKINEILLKKDKSLKDIISACYGYKILNQPDLEIMISFIISQNNSVRNISKSIEKLCFSYGDKVEFNGKEYNLFPKFEVLKSLKEEDFKKFGVGFRAKYIVNALEEISKEKEYLKNINSLSTENALQRLMEVKGIGMKVASCILMFAYGRLDAFPIDTWVKKFYGSNNEKEIRKNALEKYGEYSGLAIQYMFHYQRNKKMVVEKNIK